MDVGSCEDAEHGGTAYCSLNEGLGKVLRYGAYGPEVIERLRWMGGFLGPALQAAVRRHGPLDLMALIAQAVQMGDELHNRNRAATSLLLRELAPGLAAAEDVPRERAAEALRFAAGNEHFFLNLGMAAARLRADAARGVPGSSLVVAMARNGTDFGIQVSGTGDRWFTGPAGVPDGLYLGGYGPATPTPTSATPRSPRRPGWAGSRWPPRPRSSGSSAARCRTRSPPPSGCTRSRWPSTRRCRSRCCRSAARPPGST